MILFCINWKAKRALPFGQSLRIWLIDLQQNWAETTDGISLWKSVCLGSKYGNFSLNQKSTSVLGFSSICLKTCTKVGHPGSSPLDWKLTPPKIPRTDTTPPSLGPNSAMHAPSPHSPASPQRHRQRHWDVSSPDLSFESSHCETAWELMPSFAHNSDSAWVC